MFFMVYGAAGTGKGSIKDMLVRQGFLYLESKLPPASDFHFSNQMAYLAERMNTHLEAQKLANRKDVVTIHSPHDTHVIYSKMLLDQEKITQKEYDDLEYLYRAMYPSIEPPSACIYTFCSPLTAFDRMKLRGKSIHETDFHYQIKAYKDFSIEVKTPQVEVDFDQSMDRIQQDFTFNYASLKTTGVANQSLWERQMFHKEEPRR